MRSLAKVFVTVPALVLVTRAGASSSLTHSTVAQLGVKSFESAPSSTLNSMLDIDANLVILNASFSRTTR